LDAAESKRPTRLFTPAFFLACVLGLFATAIIVQYCEVYLAVPGALGEQVFSLPAVWVFFVLAVAGGVVFAASKVAGFSRAQLLVLFYVLTLAAPMMSQGFWQRMVSITATIPRSAQQLEKFDFLSDKLWPHGPNVLPAFEPAQVTTQGTTAWQQLDYKAQRTGQTLSLKNSQPEQTATVRFRVPVSADPQAGLAQPGEPFLVTALVRTSGLGGESRYFARFHLPGNPQPIDLFSGSAAFKKTVNSPAGFVRVGAVSARVPEAARDAIELEIGLTGRGTLDIAEPQMLSVSALDALYTGRLVVNESELDAVPVGQRHGLIVRPDNMWSLQGLAFVLRGYIPGQQWLTPMASWGVFLLLAMMTFFALVVLMHEQWAVRERFPLPLTRVPLALLGDSGEPALMRQPMAWIGVGVGLLWGVWHFLATANPNISNPAFAIDLKAYVGSPTLKPMFEGTTFNISILFIALFLLVELNVLLSLVVGYWLYRAQFWVGQANGWTSQPAFPFRHEQSLGAYLAYAAMILILAWRHVRDVLLHFVGRGPSDKVRTYRGALLALVVAGAGIVVWGVWAGIGAGGAALMFVTILAVAIVAARLRAECGLVHSYFAPYNLALVVGLVGGIATLGPSAVLFFVLIAFCFANGGMFLIVGGHLELLDLSKRNGIRMRSLTTALAVVLIGGLLIGGWVFLAGAYGFGGQQFRSTWPFDQKDWYLRDFEAQVLKANSAAAGTVAPDADKSAAPVAYAYGYAAASTSAVTIIRQIFPGFWFHPIGMVLGATHYAEAVWGSALVAWGIRRLVAAIGGAATVREKLQPFAIGLFIGGVLAGAIGVISRAAGYPPPAAL